MAEIARTQTPRTRSEGERMFNPADLEARPTCCRREVMYDALCEGVCDTACLEALFDWLDERKQ
jgi:hypothetical protein